MRMRAPSGTAAETTRRGWQLVEHELDARKQREDPGRDRRRHQAEVGLAEIRPAKLRSPRDDGHGRHRSQAGGHSEHEPKNENHAGV